MVDTFSAVYRCAPSFGRGDTGSEWLERHGLGAVEDELDDSRVAGDLDLKTFSQMALGSGDMTVQRWENRKHPVLGWVAVQQAGGTWTLKAERSLPKWLDGDNCRVLSAKEAQEAIYAYDAAIRAVAPFVDPKTARITRLDVCWQKHVGDTIAVIDRLHGAINKRWGRSVCRFDTSLEVRGRQRGFRVYDKGAESKNPDYAGVLRLEEQLRSGGKAMAAVCDGLEVNREAALALINERVNGFYEAAFGPLPIADLIQRGKHAVALLALHPEYESVYRQSVSKQAGWKMMREVRSLRAGAVGCDLTLPDDAWN